MREHAERRILSGIDIAGLATLMVSDICIGLSLAHFGWASAMIAPLYVSSLAILLAALVRGIPAPPDLGNDCKTRGS